MATTAATGVDEAVAEAAYGAAQVARTQAETAVASALSAKNQADAITASAGSNHRVKAVAQDAATLAETTKLQQRTRSQRLRLHLRL